MLGLCVGEVGQAEEWERRCVEGVLGRVGVCGTGVCVDGACFGRGRVVCVSVTSRLWCG